MFGMYMFAGTLDFFSLLLITREQYGYLSNSMVFAVIIRKYIKGDNYYHIINLHKNIPCCGYSQLIINLK